MNRKTFGVLAVAAIAVAVLVGLPLWLIAQELDERGAADDRRPHVGWRHDCDDCTHGYLGVSLRELTPELQEHFGVAGGGGVLIAELSDGGPAEAAGIRVGDVLTEIDGNRIDTPSELRREVRRRPGDTATIELVRDGQPLRLDVTLGERQVHGDWELDFDPERWAEMGERWGHWGERMGERWGRWGEEMGERWGRWGEEMGERMGERWGRWGEEMGERGEHWGEHWEEMGAELGALGAEIGLEVARAMEEMDWERIGATVEESMKVLEEMDWEAMSSELERGFEEMEKELEQSLEEMEERLEEMERRLDDAGDS